MSELAAIIEESTPLRSASASTASSFTGSRLWPHLGAIGHRAHAAGAQRRLRVPQPRKGGARATGGQETTRLDR